LQIINRFFDPKKGEHYFLFGPRGTGKSTWLRKYYPDALWVNLLEPEEFREYLTRPERLRELIQAHPEHEFIIVDEIQKIPALLSLIHSLIEEKLNIQFILTGSSARKIKREGGDLLGGRATLHHMHPFFASELGPSYSLEKSLNIGMLPLVWNAENPISLLRGYAGLYLKEEVQDEGIVRKLADFARFLEVMSFSHGSLLNATNIAEECHISRRTVDSYLNILEDLLLAYTLRVFTKRAQRELISHPKFYYFDAGVFRFLRPQGPLDKVTEIEGAALEGLVGQHLRAWCEMQQLPHSLHFWRTRTGLEVDFIVYGPRTFLAVEVKNSTQINPRDLKALKEFLNEYPEARGVIAYRGKKRLLVEGIYCIPAEELLLRIDPRHPIELS
jgi:uncharacterized protein